MLSAIQRTTRQRTLWSRCRHWFWRQQRNSSRHIRPGKLRTTLTSIFGHIIFFNTSTYTYVHTFVVKTFAGVAGLQIQQRSMPAEAEPEFVFTAQYARSWWLNNHWFPIKDTISREYNQGQLLSQVATLSSRPHHGSQIPRCHGWWTPRTCCT